MGEGCAKSSWVTNQHFCCRFSPHQQEVCDENYKKKCTIVFITQSQTEMVRSLVLNPRANFAQGEKKSLPSAFPGAKVLSAPGEALHRGGVGGVQDGVRVL